MPTTSSLSYWLPSVFRPATRSPEVEAEAAESRALPQAISMTVPSARDIIIDVDEIEDGPRPEPPSFCIHPRILHRLENLVEVIGVDAVSSRSGVERMYNLSEGTMLGLRFGEKFYEYDDQYVLDSEIRRVATSDMLQKANGRSVFWLETAGVMESGYGVRGTVNVGDMVSVAGGVSYGFSAGGVMRYRTSQVFALGADADRKKLVESQKFYMPRTATEAKLMPYGAEVELTGQGKLYSDANINFRLGPNVGMATAGATIEADTSTTVSGEFSVNVTALDGYRKVRVTVRALDHEDISFAAAFKAGLIFPPGSITPGWGAGLLYYLVRLTGYRRIEDLITAYTAFIVKYGYSRSHTGTVIASYDFDLNNKAAQQAYEEMINLSTARAHMLSKLRWLTGVSKVFSREEESTSSTRLEVTMFGEKLFLRKTLDVEREGSLEENHKEVMVYRDSIYHKAQGDFFTGKNEVDWQAVTIEDKKTGEKQPYFRFHLNRKEYNGRAENTEDYFRFARSIGISASELTEHLEDTSQDFDRAFLQADEVNTEVDIYFTTEGAKAIDEADKVAAYNAYIEVSRDINPQYSDIPLLGGDFSTLRARDIMREYRLLQTNKRVEENKKSKMQKLRQDYWSETRRDLTKDTSLVEEAEDFANDVAKLTDVTDHEQARSFFINFGKERGFKFMQSVAALQKLADPENTLVHALRRAGGGIVLQSRDEGALEHPRELVHDVLTSALPQ